VAQVVFLDCSMPSAVPCCVLLQIAKSASVYLGGNRH
jgi:hypothetical protein